MTKRDHPANVAIECRGNKHIGMLAPTRRLCAFLAVGVLLFTFATAGGVKLSGVKSWAYQLQNVDPIEIKLSPYDLVAIDYGFDRLNATAFPREVVELMRSKPSRNRRLLLAYLNVAEADESRFYWQAKWAQERPNWLRPTTDASGSFLVKYWQPEWQSILYGNADAYLDRILTAGYDGILVDGAERFEDWKRTRPTAAAEMIGLISALASYARRQRGDFLLIPQNGDALLSDAAFLRTIDGFAREELLYGEKAPQARNSHSSIADSVRRLNWVVAAGKPVFVIEYTSDPQLAASMLRELRALGFIGYVADRALKTLSPPVFGCGQPDCSQ